MHQPVASLRQKLQRREPIIGAAVGSGMTAAAAEQGGADLLLVLNAGYFRMHGCSSSAALMPYADANNLTFETATRSVLPRVGDIPVFLGLCAQDPLKSWDYQFARARRLGVAGVTNFPSVGFIDGQYREALEEAGLGFEREVELMARARDAGLLSIGFCFTPEESRAMAGAGVDILCMNLGFTQWRDVPAERREHALDDAVSLIRRSLAAAREVTTNPYMVVLGGPVVLPRDTARVYRGTGALGYIGGSSIERFPAAPLIRQSVRDFREAAQGGRRIRRLGGLIGADPSMQAVFETIERVADSDAPVLVLGESGTGKELAAREIHRLSHRGDRPLVTWNCAAVAESIAMSELFGHERGAFTGASQRRLGKFELADTATLFMDEVTELPLSLQASLLRVLQEREIVRVGGEQTIPINVRLIAATNRDLTGVVQSGAFRPDLFYRLSTIVLRLPPLRERRDDIPFLAQEFAEEFARQYGCPVPRFSDSIMAAFRDHPWPGNIRELRNAVERLVILGRGERVDVAWIEELFALGRALYDGSDAPSPRRGTGDDKRRRLRAVLDRHNGNKAAAARELGVTRKTIYSWMKGKDEG